MPRKKFFKVSSDLYWSNQIVIDGVEENHNTRSVKPSVSKFSQARNDSFGEENLRVSVPHVNDYDEVFEDTPNSVIRLHNGDSYETLNDSVVPEEKPIFHNCNFDVVREFCSSDELNNSDISGIESSMTGDNPLLSSASGSEKKNNKTVNHIAAYETQYSDIYLQKTKPKKPETAGKQSELSKKFNQLKQKKKTEKDKKEGKLVNSIKTKPIIISAMLKIKKKADEIIEQDSKSSDDEDAMETEEKSNPRKRKRESTHETAEDPSSKRQKAQIAELLYFNLKKYTSKKNEYEVIQIEKDGKMIRVDDCDAFRRVIWRYGITQKEIKLKMSDLGIDEEDYIIDNRTDWKTSDGKKEPDVDKLDTWEYRRKNKIYSTTYMNSILSLIKITFMSQTQLKDGTFPQCFGRSLPAFCIVQQKMVPTKNEKTQKVTDRLNYEINIPSQRYWNDVLGNAFAVWTEDSVKNKLGKEDENGKKLQLRMIEKAARELSLKDGFRLSKGTYDVIYYGPKNVLSCLRECNKYMYDGDELICKKFMDKLENKKFVITTAQAKPCTSLFAPNFSEAKNAHQDALAIWEKMEKDIKSGKEKDLDLDDIGEKPDLSKYLEISLHNKLCQADRKKQLPFDPWVDFLERELCPWFSLDNRNFMLKRLLQQNESNPATRIRSTNFTSLEELQNANEWTLIGGSMGEEYEPILRLIQHTVQQQRNELASRDKVFRKAMNTIANEVKQLKINETLARIKLVKQEACQSFISNRMQEMSDVMRANGLTGEKSIYSKEDNQSVTLGAKPTRTDILEIQKVRVRTENHLGSKSGREIFRTSDFIEHGSSISDNKSFVLSEMIDIQEKKQNFTGLSYGQKLIRSERDLTNSINGGTADEHIKFHNDNCAKIEKVMNRQYKDLSKNGKLFQHNQDSNLINSGNADIEIVGGSSKVPTMAIDRPDSLLFDNPGKPDSSDSEEDENGKGRINEEVTLDLFARHPSRVTESDTITNLAIQLRDVSATNEEGGIIEQEISIEPKNIIANIDRDSDNDLLSSIDKLRDRLSARDFSPAKTEKPKLALQRQPQDKAQKKVTTLFDMGFQRKRAISEGDDNVFTEDKLNETCFMRRSRKNSEPVPETPNRRSKRLIKPIFNFSTPIVPHTENLLEPKTPKQVKRTTKKVTCDHISFMDDWTEITSNEKEQSFIDKTWREMYLDDIEEKLMREHSASNEDLNKLVGLKLLTIEEKNKAFKNGFLWTDDPEKKGELTWRKQLLIKNAVQSLRCIRRNDSHIQWTCMLFARLRVVKIILNAMYVECTSRCNLPLAGEIKMIMDYIAEKSNVYEDNIFWKEIFTISDAEAEDRDIVRAKWSRMGREVPHVSLTCFYGVRKLMYALVNE